jgi:hypothetical protein
VGQLLFNYYIHLFLIVSLLLLCAMIGAIVLTKDVIYDEILVIANELYKPSLINRTNVAIVVVVKKNKK